MNKPKGYKALKQELPDRFSDELILAEDNAQLRARVKDLEGELADRDMLRAVHRNADRAPELYSINGIVLLVAVVWFLGGAFLVGKLAARSIANVDHEMSRWGKNIDIQLDEIRRTQLEIINTQRAKEARDLLKGELVNEARKRIQ